MQRVLITGATGTFGNKLIDHLLNTDIEYIVVYSRDEFKQHCMKNKYKTNKLKYIIGDVRDQYAMESACRGIDTIFHAAAIKHVKIAEENPLEAIKTNIMGTENVINAAIKNNIKRVIAVSTDKCVMPANLYGATKLCLERLVINANKQSNTKFSVVRYGNVMCSRGSVIPLFLKLKQEKGEINVTDMNATRFTITIEDAIKFVLDCSSNMLGGEIFVPKLYSYSLEQIVRVLCPDVKVNIIGLQQGDRLHELMLCESEAGSLIEQDNRYIICSDNDISQYTKVYGDNTRKCFTYSSNNNKFISDNELRTLIFDNLDQC